MPCKKATGEGLKRAARQILRDAPALSKYVTSVEKDKQRGVDQVWLLLERLRLAITLQQLLEVT